MKKQFGLLLFAFAASLNAQVVFTEDFNAPFNPSAAGWATQNNSAPTGTIGWFQGNASNAFAAFNGGPNDYFAANFNSTSATTGTGGIISNWLISPTLTLIQGATIQFATRTIATQTVFPDRMQVLVCSSANYSIPSSATAVGNFSVMFDVNQALSTSTVASGTGSIITGYPQSWTVYTATVTGITGTVTGRVAFRYFVTAAGPVGANSSYIGLDAVRYSLPCIQPTISVAQSNTAGICSGASVSLVASTTGTVAATSYTWSNGFVGSTLVATPSISTTYTVTGQTNSGCIGTQTAAVTVTVTPNLVVPSYTVCTSPAPGSITLTASGAASYSWNTSATTSSIVITPTATTAYTVTGAAAGSVCPITKTATITFGSQLSMDISASSTNICAGQVVTLTAISPATSYSWSNTSAAQSITVNPLTTSTYTVAGITGTFPSSFCAGANTINITVNAVPSISAVQSGTICSGTTFTSLASGASTYTFAYGQVNSSNNPATLNAPFVTSVTTQQYSVSATSSAGCLANGVFTISINPAPNVSAASAKTVDCVNTTVTINASGASTYTWSNLSNSSSISFSAGATSTLVSYTVTGTANGCSASAPVSVFIDLCAGIDKQALSSIKVYPNPFKDELKIDGLEGHIEIYNLLGQLQLKQEVAANNDYVNTLVLNDGVYFVKLYDVSGRELKSMKLVKH